ncbi:MAG: class I SAM-dependent methyltransferase [Deltaproteobacteria bacterium]|nr:MAG: class I SAM-dependent methyltransferase [Deltaproteobacteria bacterium]
MIDPTLRQAVMSDAQGALRLFVACVGVMNHLFDRLAEEPPAPSGWTAESLAAAAERDTAYVARWVDASVAFGLLQREGARLSLTGLGASFRSDVPGSLFPVAIQAVLSGHMAERAAGLMATGEQPGESVLTERPTILPWFGPMLEATFGPMFADQILPALPAVQALGERGGLAVDLGCGNGWYLRRLLARYPRLRGIGLDMFADNIEAARRAADAAGLGDRLDFRQGDLHRFTVDEPVDLIAMNRALHHVWAEGGDRVMAALAGHLAPGGLVVVWEPRWPDDPAALARHPRLRGMAFQNLAEHVQGNRFLRPGEITAAMEAAGMATEVLELADGAEMVVVGRLD